MDSLEHAWASRRSTHHSQKVSIKMGPLLRAWQSVNLKLRYKELNPNGFDVCRGLVTDMEELHGG